MPKSSEFINITGEDEEKLRTCENNDARAVQQITFHQDICFHVIFVPHK